MPVSLKSKYSPGFFVNRKSSDVAVPLLDLKSVNPPLADIIIELRIHEMCYTRPHISSVSLHLAARIIEVPMS